MGKRMMVPGHDKLLCNDKVVCNGKVACNVKVACRDKVPCNDRVACQGVILAQTDVEGMRTCLNVHFWLCIDLRNLNHSLREESEQTVGCKFTNPLSLSVGMLCCCLL